MTYVCMVDADATKVNWRADDETIVLRGDDVVKIDYEWSETGGTVVAQLRGTIDRAADVQPVLFTQQLDNDGLAYADTYGRTIYLFGGGGLIWMFPDDAAPNDPLVVVDSGLVADRRFDSQGTERVDEHSARRIWIETTEGDFQIAHLVESETSIEITNASISPDARQGTFVPHGIITANTSPTVEPGGDGSFTYITRTAGIDEFGDLRFNTEESGDIPFSFFEDATFAYELGGANTKGGLIRLYANRGQTNGPYAGDQWPTGNHIEIIPDVGWSLWHYPSSSTIGWHVVNTASSGDPTAELPASATITGLAYIAGDPGGDTVWSGGQYTMKLTEVSSDVSDWSTPPSGNLQDSAWFDGVEGKWTVTLALYAQGNHPPVYHVAAHLMEENTNIQASLPGTRVRFTG